MKSLVLASLALAATLGMAKAQDLAAGEQSFRKCGPCHAVAPVLDKIVDERSGELKLVKVNIDEEQGLANKYGIQSIPTMILFRDGEPANIVIGAKPKGQIERDLGLVSA